MERYQEKLIQWVDDERRIVTTRWVARSLAIHPALAKQLLYWCLRDRSNPKSPVRATYLIVGRLKALPSSSATKNRNDTNEKQDDLAVDASPASFASTPQPASASASQPSGSQPQDRVTYRGIRIVPEEELTRTRALFEKITSESIYALHPAILQDTLPLAQLQDEAEAMPTDLPPLIQSLDYKRVDKQREHALPAPAAAVNPPAKMPVASAPPPTKPAASSTAKPTTKVAPSKSSVGPPPPSSSSATLTSTTKAAASATDKKSRKSKRQIESSDEEEEEQEIAVEKGNVEEEQSKAEADGGGEDATMQDGTVANDIFGDHLGSPIKKTKTAPQEPTRTKKKLKVDMEDDLAEDEEWVWEDREYKETAKEAKTYEDEEGCLVTEYLPVTRTKTERVQVKRKKGYKPPPAAAPQAQPTEKSTEEEQSKKSASSSPTKAQTEPTQKAAPAAPAQQPTAAPAPAPPPKKKNSFGAGSNPNRKQGSLLNFFGKK